MFTEKEISPTFLTYACEVIANTENGLTGSEIVKISILFSTKFDVDIPHYKYPFNCPNKRTALFENLLKFSPKQQFEILMDIIDSEKSAKNDQDKIRLLRVKLLSKYSHLGSIKNTELETYELVEDTKHWLSLYPAVLKLYNEAFEKYKLQTFRRNVIDDMRLTLEMLVQEICKNKKSLENQQVEIGTFIKSKGSSPEFNNMLLKLIDYYTKYQNTYIKHDDSVPENEVEFIIEMTSSFIKHLIKLNEKES